MSRAVTLASLACLFALASCEAGVARPGPCGEGWVRVGPGTFDMGSPSTETGHQSNEGDAAGGPHRVTIPRAICVKATEVTQAEWRAVLGTNPAQHEDCDDCPVECVNWYEALAWCNARSIEDGFPPCYVLDGWDGAGCGGVAPGTPGACNRAGGMVCGGASMPDPACTGYRLPTEAEWEFAARAGTATATWAGDLDPDFLACQAGAPVLDAIGWYCANSGMASHPVGTRDPAPRAPNALGIHDAPGNVAEWVQDPGHPSYAGAPTDGSAWESGGGPGRVVRGGSWLTDGVMLRAAARTSNDPRRRLGDVGFRPCRTLPAAP